MKANIGAIVKQRSKIGLSEVIAFSPGADKLFHRQPLVSYTFRMKNVRGFYCSRCLHDFALSGPGTQCPQCHSSVELKMDLSGIFLELKDVIKKRPRGLWRWKEFLPVNNDFSLPTLGEGDTPLISCERIRRELDIKNLFFKCEFLLPTGSLKDRSVAVAMNHALSISAKAVAVASTGNHAASVAAYAAASGLKAFVFVPEKTDLAKVNQAAIHGAIVVRVKGTMEDAGKLLHQALVNFGWYPCITSNPYRNEGKKTCAYEIWEQMGESIPDFMVHPIGGGIGLWAAWKGWRELQELKWISQIPKMIGAQAINAAPIGQAWAQNSEDAVKVDPKPTCAESIGLASVTPGVGLRTLQAIRNSFGECVNLTDEKIMQARGILAKQAGIFVEPAAAASLAAIIEMRKKNVIQSHHQVVCMLTGQGLKQTVESDKNNLVINNDSDFQQLEKSLKELEVQI